MKPCKSDAQMLENGDIRVVLCEESQMDARTILSLSQEIFSRPLTEDDCLALLQTIIDMQTQYSDEIADLEGVLEATVETLYLYGYRIGAFGNSPDYSPSAGESAMIR